MQKYAKKETPNLSTDADSSSAAKKLLSKEEWGGGDKASISEHLPVFRAPRESDGRSAPVHGLVTLHTSPRTQKKLHERGQTDMYINWHRDY